MDNFDYHILDTAPVFTFLIGMMECFFGYRMLKIVLGVTGFIAGGLLFVGLVHETIGHRPVLALIAGLVGGVIGSWMMIGLFIFGVFILGAVLGFIVGEAVSISIFGLANPMIVVPFVIVGGIAAVIMTKSMVIISTSFIGAYLIVFSTGKFIGMQSTIFRFHEFNGPRELGGQFFVILLFYIILGIAGVIVQYKYTATSAGMGRWEKTKGDR
jgi:asparagine N-glycosylation enzyme membrane subunit Stt3